MTDSNSETTDLTRTDTPPSNPYAITIADPAAIAAAEAAKQRLQAAFTMAKQFPRDVDQARHKILASCKRPRFAEVAEYKKPIGRDKFLTGPSIRLAELCLREWGNIMAESSVVFEDPRTRRLSVTVIDLETNTRFSKEITIVKTVERKNGKGRDIVGKRLNSWGDSIFIVVATEDEVAVKEAAAISKTLRNEGLRCVPQDVIDEAIDIARGTMAGQYTNDPAEAKKGLLDAFASIRVTPKMLADYLGHGTDEIALDEWQELRSLYSGVKEGSAKWSEIIERKKKRDIPTGPTEGDDDSSDPTVGATE